MASWQAAAIYEQGPRPYMEDAYHLDTDFAGLGWLFGGIYDGHGGDFAAKYAAENLHSRFRESLLGGQTPEQAFIETYQAISDELKRQGSGTTAVDFLIQGSAITAANAGDARAIVVSRHGVTQLTVDHRLDDDSERERIIQMGGRIAYPYVYRGFSGIMPTRTLGDEFFKPVGIIATPSVRQYRVSGDDLVLVVGCDGLFDFMSNEDISGFARRNPQPEQLVQSLKKEVLRRRQGSDNLTIVAVGLH